MVLVAAAGLLASSGRVSGSGPPEALAQRLVNTAKILVEKTHYLEAMDLLQEARDSLDGAGLTGTALYADVLFALAETKIKARLYQNFPAYYVKTALEEVQAANKIRERLAGVLPQKLSQGYYVEGFIHVQFFKRNKDARSCFLKAVNVDAGNAAAKRALSELDTGEQAK